MGSDYFPVHAHTAFSGMDGMGKVKDHVQRIADLGQPGVAFTEHGNMGSVVQAYQATRKAGLAYFPACEFYVVKDVDDPDTRDKRYHLGMMALDLKGYQALTNLMTLSWQAQRFHRKPLIDLGDLAFLSEEGYADHIAVTTGCYFGLVIDQWQAKQGPWTHADHMIAMLQRWFPHLYVELQNHGITHPDGTTDLDISMTLHGIAQQRGLPVVMGGDSHYIDASEQGVHDLMKGICYHGNDEDTKFPGGPYHLVSTDEAKAAMGPLWDDVEAGHSDLLSKHALTIPPLDNYKFHVPKMYDQPQDVLRKVVHDCLVAKGFDQRENYRLRVDQELEVIDAMRFSNYFLLVKTHVTDYARDNGILVNARGSVNGSLVTFLLGISNVDPLVWNTSFDRFLSKDRKKPPDIDIDVDFRGRDKMIAHLRAVFPTMVQVGTYAKIGITNGDNDEGSVFVQYMAAMRRKVPNFDGKVRREDRPYLERLADTEVYKSMGTNAAGFILPGDDLPIKEYLPLGRIISSGTVVTQFNKDDVEALGYMKMDILGLRALQTLNGTLVRIGRQPNEWDWIPWDDKKACALLRSGNGIGLFQYEGYSSQMGGKEMGIKSTKDTILGLALYRPALMNGGQKDQYLAVRFKKPMQTKLGVWKYPEYRLHPVFDKALSETKGVPLFQEQIMEMLKALGMAFAEYNDLMTAIKASNGFIQGAAETFERLQPLFYDLAEEKGLTPEECDLAWDAVVGFTEYGFNKAHATSYGIMSYYSAYLKAHHPLEYMASLLDVWAGVKDKEREYTKEAKRLGFNIARADVNYSQASWDLDPQRKNTIRRGLVSLDGIGWSVAEAIVEVRPDGGFVDLGQFLDLTPRRPVTAGPSKNPDLLKGVAKTLKEAGAFRSLGV